MINLRTGSLTASVSSRLRTAALSSGPLAREVFYRAKSRRFAREMRAVGAGVARYQATQMGANDIYHLRRNIHMLEKGLVMRPRRDEFGLAYIGETVDLFESVLLSGNSGSEELAWFWSVLSEYFEATAASLNGQILTARKSFQTLHAANVLNGSGHSMSGPSYSPNLKDSPHIDIDDFTKFVTQRRSVRWFTEERISREKVDAAVHIARESPTACNRQPYRFVIADDPSFAQLIARIPMGTAGFAQQVPAIAAVVGDLSAFFDERDRHLIYIDGSLAAMGFIYGLEAQGISSCVINWPDIASKELEIREVLELDSHEQVVMLIAFGYASEDGMSPFSGKKSIDSARFYFNGRLDSDSGDK